MTGRYNANPIYKFAGSPSDKRDLYLSYLIGNPEDKAIIKAWSKLKGAAQGKAIDFSYFSEPRDYLVSAIVSTYSSEAFIRECLDNLYNQSIADKIEIVIVDAASPENENKIIKEYYSHFRNITYLRTKRRISVYSAWNMAIKASTGTYCISVSTNDQLKRNACQILSDYLEQHPQCMLVFGDTVLTKQPHETFEDNTHYAKYEWPDYTFEFLLYHCYVGPHPMWRKRIHRLIGFFDERYLAIGDQEFWLRMGEKFEIHHLKEFTGLQWINDNSLSSKGNTPQLESLQIHAYYQNRFNQKSNLNKNLD